MADERFKARKTTYKGITMRSRLEAGFAQWLDQWLFDWSYEPRAFASQHGQYLPDFELRGIKRSWSDEILPVYVDVKPESFDLYGEAGTDLSNRMTIVWDSEPEADLFVAMPDRIGTGTTLYWRRVTTDDSWWVPASWTVAGYGPLRIGIALTVPSASAPWDGDWWKP